MSSPTHSLGAASSVGPCDSTQNELREREESSLSLNLRAVLKRSLIAGYCHHVIPARVVALGFRLFRLGAL